MADPPEDSGIPEEFLRELGKLMGIDLAAILGPQKEPEYPLFAGEIEFPADTVEDFGPLLEGLDFTAAPTEEDLKYQSVRNSVMNVMKVQGDAIIHEMKHFCHHLKEVTQSETDYRMILVGLQAIFRMVLRYQPHYVRICEEARQTLGLSEMEMRSFLTGVWVDSGSQKSDDLWVEVVKAAATQHYLTELAEPNLADVGAALYQENDWVEKHS